MNLLYRPISYSSNHTKQIFHVIIAYYLLLSVTLTLEEIYCTLVNTIFLARGLSSDSNYILAADSKSVISFCLSHQVFEQWDDEKILWYGMVIFYLT